MKGFGCWQPKNKTYHLQINCCPNCECSRGFILVTYEQARYTHDSQCQKTLNLNASRAEGKDRKGPHYGHIGDESLASRFCGGFFALLVEPWTLFVLFYLAVPSLSAVHRIFSCRLRTLGFPGGSAGQESACSAGGLGSVPGLGRTPGEGGSYPLQFWPGEYQGLYSPQGRKELAMKRANSWLWHAGSSSLTRDRIRAPCFGNPES